MSAVRRLARTLPPLLRVQVRGVRRVLDRSAGERLTAAIGEAHAGNLRVRPLRRQDGPAWSRAMRANHARMSRWWAVGDDVAHTTDALAFEEHLRAWELRRRQGHGICMALVEGEDLVGELQVWHLTPGGLTCEVGLWLSPETRRVRDAVVCMGYVFDRLFSNLGLRRAEAPVAVANPLPRRMLELAGFEIEARIPAWRQVGDELVDFDLYALTPERWVPARDRGFARFGGWSTDCG